MVMLDSEEVDFRYVEEADFYKVQRLAQWT